MFNKLGEIIKKVEGNVLTIGLDDSLLDKFKKNNKVNLYCIYSSENNGGLFSRDKKKKTNQGKQINIKKLRKYLKKKSAKYIILNIDEVMKYYKYIIRDTIYLNNNLIYVYSPNNLEKDFIISRYKRYNVKIESINYKNGYIITINNTQGKNNYFKDKWYFIKDTLYNIAEYIGNVLVS